MMEIFRVLADGTGTSPRRSARSPLVRSFKYQLVSNGSPSHSSSSCLARSRMGSVSFEGDGAAELRIEEVAQAVAEEVEAKNTRHDRRAGEQREPRRLLQVEPSLGEHVAPRRHLGRNAHAEERERGFAEHG